MASPDKTPEELDLEKQKSLESPLGPPRNAEPPLADPDRLRLCQEVVTERPYSHPVAAGWYAEDVPKLLARVRERTEALRRIKNESNEPMIRGIALRYLVGGGAVLNSEEPK